MNAWIKTLAAISVIAGANVSQSLPVSGQGTWETTLQPRDLDNNSVTDAYYDTALDITWLANANVNGPMTWDAANIWATTTSFFGISGWRLPSTTPGGDGLYHFSYDGTSGGWNVSPSSSEMAYLFHLTLGNISGFDTSGAARVGSAGVDWGLVNTGPFTGLQAGVYWSSLYVPPGGTLSGWWYFDTRDAGQSYAGTPFHQFYAMAVRDGDVVAGIPEPQTYLLMLTGIAALLVARRRRSGRGFSASKAWGRFRRYGGGSSNLDHGNGRGLTPPPAETRP